MRTTKPHHGFPVVAYGLALLVVLTGCSAPAWSGWLPWGPAGGTTVPSQPSPSSAPAPLSAQSSPAVAQTVDAELVKLVPADIAASGKLIVATDASHAENIPAEFVGDDGTSLVGLDIDLAAAIGQRLGLAVQFEDVPAAEIEPGLRMGTYQLALSSLAVTPSRLASVDMVIYGNIGTKLAGLAGNPERLGINDLCGRTVAALQGSDQVADLVARGQACLNAGKPAIKAVNLRDTSELALALLTKKVSGVLADSLSVDYISSATNGQVHMIGRQYDEGQMGIALGKGKRQLAQAIQATLRALIADGTYERILRNWNAPDMSVDNSEIRLAASAG